jgi:hypothetical protein
MSYEPKLVHLPGTRLAPAVVLHRTLDKLDRIRAVTVVIQWDDDTFDVDWSQMKASELAMASLVLGKTATDIACPISIETREVPA